MDLVSPSPSFTFHFCRLASSLLVTIITAALCIAIKATNATTEK